jgi:hypothetical protein
MQRTDTSAAPRCRPCLRVRPMAGHGVFLRVRPMAGHDAKIALVER